MTKLTVDRIEGEYAVCELEDGSFKDILLSDLPSELKEGSMLVYSNGTYSIDYAAQEERKAKLFALQNSIFDE